MKSQRLLVGLTILNVGVLALSLTRSVAMMMQGVAPVLRGRALQIVDDSGRVRASIAVLPADPTVRMPDGTVGYPETCCSGSSIRKDAPTSRSPPRSAARVRSSVANRTRPMFRYWQKVRARRFG